MLFETRQVTHAILPEPVCSVRLKRVPARYAESDQELLLESDTHRMAALTRDTAYNKIAIRWRYD